ncbi:LacI family DNA-binding transcriptional regulator [Arthrobacter sp. R-11]|uniref:LacI family DNA-binding transcriptional regulator n=1 Tax=Arthrobacter sp. R-11 TaxID=3404053 RepID=UPI003CF6E96F
MPANPGRPADIRDVAEAAGVSTATVSRALRGVPRVADATRQRVLEAARGLGYVPSTAASELGRSRGAAWPSRRAAVRRGSILVLTGPEDAVPEISGASHGISVRCVPAEDGATAAGILEGVDPSVLGIVVGAGRAVHASAALRDAVTAVHCPVVEVITGNPYQPGQAWQSLLSAACSAVIAGAGSHGFRLAVDYLAAGAGRNDA